MDMIFAEQLLSSLRRAFDPWTPYREAWLSALLELDRSSARHAADWVIKHNRRAPTIAEFLDVYRQERLRSVEDGDICGKCAGTGWVTDTNHPFHFPGDISKAPVDPVDGSCMCNVVSPCDCLAGGVAKDVHRKIGKDRARRDRAREEMTENRVPMPEGLRSRL